MRGLASGLGVRISSMVGLFIAIIATDVFIRRGIVVFGNLRLDVGNLVLVQPISLVQFGVGPLLCERQIWHEAIYVLRRVLSRLAQRHKESDEATTQISCE